MRKGLVAALVVLFLGAAIWGWVTHKQRQAAELQLGIDSARVLSQAFTAANLLKVAEIEGELIARADDPGMIRMLAASQTMKAPYAVDYFVDLRGLPQSAYAWDAAGKRLIVEIPDVTLGKPNIDEGAATISQSGLYISRTAGLRMQRKASQALTAKAGELAQTPENLKRAREAALAAVRTNALAPLRAAGIENVVIEVRFAFQRNNSDDVWDYTTPLDQVAEKLARMKGEPSPGPVQ